LRDLYTFIMKNEITLLIIIGVFLLMLVILPTLTKIIKRQKAYRLMKKSGIKNIDRMDGYKFEEYLKVLFKELGYRPAITKKSGDFGADVILKGKNKIVIQAKRYGYKNRVSMDAIREVFASKYFYEADEAWVITNSFFTKQAMQLAKPCNVKLLNRYDLQKFIVEINKESKSFSKIKDEKTT